LRHTFADLGLSPIANAFRQPQDRGTPEPFYPLHAYVCATCMLVQLPALHRAEALFTSDYPYLSSISGSWLRAAEAFSGQIAQRLRLAPPDEVIEVASNDGYLLQFFLARGLRVLGIDPAATAARAFPPSSAFSDRRWPANCASMATGPD
jgi:hypothetical protein